jgi:5-methylcytosine-specific restriction endonuclease McrA
MDEGPRKGVEDLVAPPDEMARIEKYIRVRHGDSSGVRLIESVPLFGVQMIKTNAGGLYFLGGKKVCAACGELKSFDEFAWRIAKYGDGRQNDCKECNRRYYASRKDEYDKYHAEYRRAFPEKRKAAMIGRNHKRRAKLRGNGGTYTAADLAAIRAAQTDKRGRLICWKCNTPIIGDDPPPHLPNGVRLSPHLDHWIPLDKGGTNDAGNLHYMHGLCNLEKGAKTPTEIGRLI